MEGFWTIQFEGIQGWGAGVITLEKGQVFGGDTGFTYIGTYEQDGGHFKGRVHVKRHSQGIPNVMGRDEFDLEIEGDRTGAHTMVVNAVIPCTPLRLKGTMTKQKDLPVAA
jgi:hypothetical protein